MTEARRIRVLVVDDHPLMRAGILGEINAQSDMEVVGEAIDGIEAVHRFRVCRPDVTLMDVRMPNANGIEAIEKIRLEFPHSRFIVLTTAAGDIQATRAFRAGAVGYLLKNTLRNDLVDAIRAVNAGLRRMPPEIAQQIADHVVDDALTHREIDVLQGVAKGNSNKIIADKLCISENTVKNHLKSILSKLAANDRTHAVMIALQRGFLEM